MQRARAVRLNMAEGAAAAAGLVWEKPPAMVGLQCMAQAAVVAVAAFSPEESLLRGPPVENVTITQPQAEEAGRAG